MLDFIAARSVSLIHSEMCIRDRNMDVLNELYDVFTAIEADADIRAVILTGEGRAFVAGADIAQMNQLNALEGRQMMIMGHKVMNRCV